MTTNTSVDQVITIVSGLPRSGTSMMMQMLVAGGIPALTDNERRPDEDNPRGYYEFEAVKQVSKDASWLPAAEGKVVKMVYKLLYDLPADRAYRVVMMLRKLDEVVASQDVMLQRLGHPSTGLEPDRLTEIYRSELDRTLDWLRHQPTFEVLAVRYDDVFAQPERIVGELNEFLGGHLDTAAMLRIPDRSLHRQRR